ncbi:MULTISPECIES: tyrosine-type recombinase/integrase [Nonomuraea]|uniref:tyrosine-type recombinase/integrase n=1 Tax=Nonomuraea ceibae TaxID=1935170 RepID=UPI001C6035A0|nr:tyrosine-type recombinase/integrase [Nonomuraea ceibae]
MTDRFYQICYQAGLPPIRLHDPRHLAATAMLAAGVDIKLVHEVLGHKTASFTRYLHQRLPRSSRTRGRGDRRVPDRIAGARAPAGPTSAEHNRNPVQRRGGTGRWVGSAPADQANQSDATRQAGRTRCMRRPVSRTG